MRLAAPPSPASPRLAQQAGQRSGFTVEPQIRAVESALDRALKLLPYVDDHSLNSTKLLGASYLKLINPLVLGTTLGGSVFNIWRWPLTMIGMGGSYLGGKGAEHLAKGLLQQADYFNANPHIPKPKFMTNTATTLMMQALQSDFSGLLVDPTRYKELGNRSKYDHFLTLINKMGAHYTGIYKPNHGPSFTTATAGDTRTRQWGKSALEHLHSYESLLSTRKLNSAKHTAPLMSLGHHEHGMSRIARGVNALTKYRAVRWVTTTPLMAIMPKLQPSYLSNTTHPPVWIEEIPIVGDALADKISSLSKARSLYFRTDPQKDLETLRLTHWKSFIAQTKRANHLIDAHGQPNTPKLKVDDTHFKVYLEAASRHEKQLAVRLALYKTVFGLYNNRPGNLADLLQRWHDVDAAAMRSMFDIAQCGNLKQGMGYLISNTINEGWERIANGGFSAIMEFGVSQIPPPLYAPARVVSQLIELAFDIERKPITKQPFSYNAVKNPNDK